MAIHLETTPKVHEDGFLAALARPDRHIADIRVRRRRREHALALRIAPPPPGGFLTHTIKRSHAELGCGSEMETVHSLAHAMYVVVNQRAEIWGKPTSIGRENVVQLFSIEYLVVYVGKDPLKRECVYA